MAIALDDIVDRALATRNAQNAVSATWLWDELDMAGWDAALADIRTRQQQTAQAQADSNAARGSLDAALDDLEARTLQGVGMARVRYRSQPALLAVVEGWQDQGESRAATLDEAKDWQAIWEQTDPAWNPTNTNTFAAFQTLRAQCLSLQQAYAQAKSIYRRSAEQLNTQVAHLDDLNTAWYAAATRVFREGTPEGDMIRGTVPTTYSPSANAKPATPNLTPTPNPAPTPTPPQP